MMPMVKVEMMDAMTILAGTVVLKVDLSYFWNYYSRVKTFTITFHGRHCPYDLIYSMILLFLCSQEKLQIKI